MNEASAVVDTSSEDDTDSSQDEEDAPNSREKRQISWYVIPTNLLLVKPQSRS